MKKSIKKFSIFKSPFGNLFLLSQNNALIALDFKKQKKHNEALLVFNDKFHNKIEKELEEYFKGIRKKFTIKLKPSGTRFQKKAWKALLQIPYGEVSNYKKQSEVMNCPNAFRATGNANGKNPIPIIIPCHRVVKSNFFIGGYSGDLKLKKDLLKIEGLKVHENKVIV